jgi:hypothetical protein
MADGYSKRIKKPQTRSRFWTSFIGVPGKGRAIRGLQEEENPEHRARVVYNKHTLLVHVSDERGPGWTTIAIDRATREWAVAQRTNQNESAEAACSQLYI